MLATAPSGFTFSCYNYTENYREGSIQAKRHHCGKDINAALSPSKLPRTGVKEIAINLHWSTCNVNSIIDEHQNSIVISKEAKDFIVADIFPVQLPDHSWKSVNFLIILGINPVEMLLHQ